MSANANFKNFISHSIYYIAKDETATANLIMINLEIMTSYKSPR